MSNPIDLRKYAVLYVDDEEQALKYFQKGLGKDFQIFTAPGVDDAAQILERESGKVGVVITDQRMPGKQGTELLKMVTEKWPSTVRILITAYSDIESAIDAVNGGCIWKYVTKPASFPVLKQTLKDAMELFCTRAERDTLLNEKMSILRQVVVSDRVRSFAEMANGLSHHLRNSVTAMNCFLEELTPVRAADGSAMPTQARNEYTDKLWALANEEQGRLVQMIQKIQDCAAAPAASALEDTDLGQLLTQAAAGANKDLGVEKVIVQVGSSIGLIKVDVPMVADAIKTLMLRVARSGSPDGKVTASANALVPLWNTQAVQVFVRGEGPAWSEQDVATFFTPYAFPQKEPSELGTSLLMAFFVVQHHSGDVIVHPSGPSGPGFELLLPLNPADVSRPEWKDHLLGNVLNAPPKPQAASAA